MRDVRGCAAVAVAVRRVRVLAAPALECGDGESRCAAAVCQRFSFVGR